LVTIFIVTNKTISLYSHLFSHCWCNATMQFVVKLIALPTYRFWWNYDNETHFSNKVIDTLTRKTPFITHRYHYHYNIIFTITIIITTSNKAQSTFFYINEIYNHGQRKLHPRHNNHQHVNQNNSTIIMFLDIIHHPVFIYNTQSFREFCILIKWQWLKLAKIWYEKS
jgi:hypothetical protein